MEKMAEEAQNLIGGNSTPEGPQITVGGKTVTLTEENVKDYLGRKVTNFKTNDEGIEVVKDTEYQVSKTYRLYYVDFGNKYGDGEETIYLKADCTSNSYTLPLDETSNDTDDNIKIKKLNPELYKSENGGAPDASTANMQAVTWLLNTENWESLKKGVTDDVEDKINYIVGAPSLEMMMDSYNMHYNLKGDTPDNSEITEEEVKAGKRKKLFYRYNCKTSENGYQVGPCHDNSAEYANSTSSNSIYPDEKIGSMYYPGDGQYYWLASPSSMDFYCVRGVNSANGGYVDEYMYSSISAFCPLVSLDSSIQLSLEGE